MSVLEITDTPRWEVWTEFVDIRLVQQVENVTSTGTPPERVGAAIVDQFADDLRRLADA
jgi:hypothetical protein